SVLRWGVDRTMPYWTYLSLDALEMRPKQFKKMKVLSATLRECKRDAPFFLYLWMDVKSLTWLPGFCLLIHVHPAVRRQVRRHKEPKNWVSENEKAINADSGRMSLYMSTPNAANNQLRCTEDRIGAISVNFARRRTSVSVAKSNTKPRSLQVGKASGVR